MENPYEAFPGRGGRPETIEQEIFDFYNPMQGMCVVLGVGTKERFNTLIYINIVIDDQDICHTHFNYECAWL